MLWTQQLIQNGSQNNPILKLLYVLAGSVIHQLCEQVEHQFYSKSFYAEWVPAKINVDLLKHIIRGPVSYETLVTSICCFDLQIPSIKREVLLLNVVLEPEDPRIA